MIAAATSSEEGTRVSWPGPPTGTSAATSHDSERGRHEPRKGSSGILPCASVVRGSDRMCSGSGGPPRSPCVAGRGGAAPPVTCGNGGGGGEAGSRGEGGRGPPAPCLPPAPPPGAPTSRDAVKRYLAGRVSRRFPSPATLGLAEARRLGTGPRASDPRETRRGHPGSRSRAIEDAHHPL